MQGRSLWTFIKAGILVTALMASSIAPGAAQTNNGGYDFSAQTNNGGYDFSAHTDELRLDGIVRSVDAVSKRFVVEAELMVSPSNATGEIATPGMRLVQADRAAVVWQGEGVAQNVTFDNLTKGTEVVVIGQDLGLGTPIRARLIAVLGGTRKKPAPAAQQAKNQSAPVIVLPKPLPVHILPAPAPVPNSVPTAVPTTVPAPVRAPVRTPASTPIPGPLPAPMKMATAPEAFEQFRPQSLNPAGASASPGVGTASATTGRATNPITAPGNTVPNLAALDEAARTRFRALRSAQDQIQYTYFSGGNAQEKLVALTFDDGPHLEGTRAILDVLRYEVVPATFFVIGRNAERHPELVLRALAEGHDIGNHTYNHHQGATLTLQQWRSEIEQTNQVLTRIIGAPSRWFRAPGCRYTSATLQAIQEFGMVRVDTTNNSSDWDKRSAAAICDRVLSGLAPGNVILMHDPMPETALALPRLIRDIRNQGYRFVSLAELAQRAQDTPGFEPVFRPNGQGVVITK